MKKGILLLVSILMISFSSCSKDDDATSSSLKGTHWVRTTNETIHFTFTTDSDFVYVEFSRSYPGIYSFDGTKGELRYNDDLDDPIGFRVNKDIMITDQNSAEDTLYKKQ